MFYVSAEEARGAMLAEPDGVLARASCHPENTPRIFTSRNRVVVAIEGTGGNANGSGRNGARELSGCVPQALRGSCSDGVVPAALTYEARVPY